jgi:SAM-dependent methyltransferase
VKNIESWVPTNIIPTDTGWAPNKAYIAPWSTYITDLECAAYLEVLKGHVHGDLLDLGAGTLPYYGVYRDFVTSVTASDWQNSHHETGHIDVISDLNEGIPFKSDAFDTVLLADVLEHTHEPQNVFNESSRVLRRGGKLLLFVPFMYGIHEEPFDYYRYTSHELERLSQEAGLRVIDIKPFGGGPDVIIDTAQKLIGDREMMQEVFANIFAAVNRSGVLNGLRQKHANKIPLGYTLVSEKI